MHGLDTSNVSSRVESSQVEFELYCDSVTFILAKITIAVNNNSEHAADMEYRLWRYGAN